MTAEFVAIASGLCVAAGAILIETWVRARLYELRADRDRLRGELARLRAALAALEKAWRAQADSHPRHDVQAFCAGHADELSALLGGES